MEDRRLLNGGPLITGTTPGFLGASLYAGTNTLAFEFSEPVVGGDNAANYQLQSLGPDAVLGTPDDTVFPLSVSYAGTTATLSFPALPESVFRLTVHDAITDSLGNALDGDEDGSAGGDWVQEFATSPMAAGLFDAGASFPTGAYSRPQSIVAADFNGDGVLDLVTANAESNNVTLSLGDGSGEFVMVGTFSSGGTAPSSVVTSDFNGDGKSDLAVANSQSNAVAVFMGNGAGGFAAAVQYASGGLGSTFLTVGDFNGDGKADLAIANAGSNDVGVLLGNGSGAFVEAMNYASGGSSPRSIVVGDFNADGATDLAVANAGSNDLGVLLGNGSGGYAEAVTYASGGSSPRSVTTGDFNADGKIDLAVANFSSHSIGILSGDGSGGFAAAVTYASRASYPGFVTVGDLNADGQTDLVLACGAYVSLMLADGSGGFAAAQNYDPGNSSPSAVVVDDFNGDGNLDVAVANTGSNNVAVFLGNGTGGFIGFAGRYALSGTNPNAVATGDFNGDGKSDLAVANISGSTIGLLLGDGSGGFATAVSYDSGGSWPRSLAVGDFNRDGNADLAVASFYSNNVSILLGNGSGSFAAAVTYDSGGGGTRSVTVGDFNADGKTDLAVANYYTNDMSVLLGNGAGGFARAVTYNSGGVKPVSVTAGDFNADGNLDLAVANSGSANVGVLLGNGSGGFATATLYATGGSNPHSLTAGDFNADGRADLAVTNYDSNNVGVLLGNGAGGFAAAVAYASGGYQPESVTVSDFDGDGKTDLAVANHGSNEIGILLGNGSGGFATAMNYASGGRSPISLAVGDFDADGKADLAFANDSTNSVRVLRGNGLGGFLTATTYPSGGSQPESVAAGDFNGDGKNDLAVANRSSGNIGIMLGNGAGNFAAAATYPSGGTSPKCMTVGDFNGDGKLDVAVGYTSAFSIGVLVGDGAGGFAPAVTYPSGSLSYALATDDFNGDGNADLALAGNSGVWLSVLLGNGAGGFASPVTYLAGGSGARSIITSDFNRDGKADLAVGNYWSDNVSVLLGDGLGGFATGVVYASGGTRVESVAAGDFNGDGIADLAVANGESNNIGVLLGNGSGSFSAAVVYLTSGTWPIAIVPADYNADGKTDLAVAHYGSDTVGVLVANGTGSFSAAVLASVSGGWDPRAMTSGDFDGDGKPDLATANTGSDNVSVLLNRAEPTVRSLQSPGATQFSVQAIGFGAGQLLEATGNAFDGMGRLEVAGQTFAPVVGSGFLADGDRTVVTPTVVIAGLYVSREITVPGAGNEDFARTIEVLENPSDSAITTTLRIVGNLGSDGQTTVWNTSDGDSVIETTDQWIGTDDADGSGTPAIVHYIQGLGGLQPTQVRLTGDRGDNIEWTFEVTVPAGQTVRLAHYTILADTRAQAEAAAGTLVTPDGFGGQAAAFLTADELASLANFVYPPADLRIRSVSLDGGTQLTVTYEVVGGPTAPFEIGFYRSADTAFGGDILLDSVTISSAPDVIAGVHTKTLTIGGGEGQVGLPGAGAEEVDADYYLLAVADPQDLADETGWSGGETNNSGVMTGVYHVAGGPVMVHGTGARDVVKVLPKTGPQRVQVDVNGVIYEYAPNDVAGIRVRGHNGSDEFQLRVDSGFGAVGTLAFLFDGGSGTNTAKLWGSTSTTTKDVAEFFATKGSLRGPGYTLSLAGMRGMTVAGQGGPDEAYLYDSSLNDTFTAYPTYVTLSNSLYTNRAEGFRNVFAYAQVGGAYGPAGGSDTAYFYGIDGAKDYLRASATYAIMADAETGRGITYFVRANGFEQVHAYGRAAGGRPSAVDRDQATLLDAGTADLFEADTADALATYAYTGASTVNAHTFRVVKAYGASGDTADLFGPGTYTPTPNPVMSTADYTVWANRFDPPNWYPGGRSIAQSSPATAVDAALPLLFGEDPSTPLARKKASAATFDLALIALPGA